MTQVFTLLGFVAELATIQQDMEELPRAIVAKACAMITKQSKDQIGKQHEEWPPLTPGTIADRVHHGFAPNQPLLRTGEMRDSIEWTVQGHGSHVEGAVGSNSDIAVLSRARHQQDPAAFVLGLQRDCLRASHRQDGRKNDDLDAGRWRPQHARIARAAAPHATRGARAEGVGVRIW